MNIGEAAGASGISAKMIFYYESIGLIRRPHRTDSNYRVHSSDEVKDIAAGHIAALQTKIDALQGMVKTFKYLAYFCGSDDRPDCLILDDLAGEMPASKGR
ncbi:MAG: MerR family DNA-binding transcriptional regulator [Candidatus Devosia symbiotica]|nr:MerR family DNA-binding transcriptional regulator [Candidatus Devosia symbiotica]